MPASETAVDSVGTFLEWSPNRPATRDAAGFAGVLGWVEVAELDSIGEYGPTTSIKSRTPLKTGITEKRGGTVDYGDMALESAMVRGDAGHQALETARKSRALGSWRINYPDGTKECGEAIVASYIRKPGDAESYLNAGINLALSGEIVTIDPA